MAAPSSSPLQLKDLLEIHKTLSEEMRHTATTVWQFAVAIVTLQGGAIAVTGAKGFEEGFLGKIVIVTAFFVSVWFSIMLYRQAHDRTGFRDRIWAVEKELRNSAPMAFQKIERAAPWFSSTRLSWVLVVESSFGLVLSVLYLLGRLK